jgi:two-component system cell cycle sensor histidine kinase/response regulator CckA
MPDATAPRKARPTPGKSWQAYVFAFAATAATLGLRLALDRHLGGQATLVVFTVPIMLSAYLGGLGAGLLATALSCFAVSYFLLPPIDSFLVASEAERWQLFFVAVAGFVVSALNEALHRARRRADLAIREHEESERELAESEGRYRALVEWSPEALAVHRDGKLLFVNPAFVQLLAGAGSDDLVGISIDEFLHPDFHQVVRDRAKALMDHGTLQPLLEERIVALDGREKVVEAQSTSIVYEGHPAIFSSLRDISLRKAHETEILRLNRLYSALSHVNKAIVRLPNRDDLFQSVCRILVEHGGLRMAWIGWHFPDTEELVQVAAAGDVGDYLANVRVYSDDRPEGRGPSGTAFREARPFVCNDMVNEPATLPWREAISRQGFRACAVFPIREKGKVSGVLNVYALEPGFFKDGESALLEEVAHDISFALDNLARENERIQSELALRAERDRAQRYLDTAEAILLALDLQGRITLVNRFACAIFGYTAEELIGRDFIETCVPAAIRDETRKRLGKVLAGPDTSIVENPIVTSSGKERLIEWRNTLLRDEAGRVVSTLSSGIDLTERRDADDVLRTADERMRFALQNANVGIWDMDYATGQLKWSETIEAHYGLAPGTFDGRFETFIERTHPDDRASLLETVGRAMKSGEDFTTQNRSRWPDGTVRWLNGSGRILLGENGEPVRGVGISLDVTERHTLEAQFQQAQKMEAVGRLAGGVAHDFNNLLTAILGYCELLLTDTGPDDPRRQDIAEIQKAGTSAAGLTRQLLAFSRKQIIQPTLLDLNEIVSGLRAMVGRLIGEDVTIRLGLAPEPALVKADRGQVEQVLLNLAVNARDAMPKGGTLTIETANVELDENYTRTHLSVTPGKYVRLTVSDTGTGMTAEVQARLFEPFFTTKEVGKGTGLGLATVHGVVARSGGSVGVYSELGTGTSFKVYLPRAAAEDSVPKPIPAPAPSATRKHTILVVEDAEGLRELARRLLKQHGYTVLVAANAQEALRLFDVNESIDVLLTDVVMPGTSGPELSRQLIERRPGLKVIYMSGYTDEAIVQHGVLNPGIALLNKPFTSDALERKIREVLSR